MGRDVGTDSRRLPRSPAIFSRAFRVRSHGRNGKRLHPKGAWQIHPRNTEEGPKCTLKGFLRSIMKIKKATPMASHPSKPIFISHAVADKEIADMKFVD